MRATHTALAVLLALTAATACDSDRLVTPDAAASISERVRFDALPSASCRNVRGSATAALDPSTGQTVGLVTGDLTGTHAGSGVGFVQHGNGAGTQAAQAIYVTNEVGTFVLAETLVIAHVSPTLFKVTFRANVVPGDDVTSGFLTGQGYMDVSGLPQGEFDYHGRLCT